MSRSPDELPPALQSLWRTFKLGYRAEPKLLAASIGAVVVGAIPDVLVALLLKVMSDAVIDGERTTVIVAGLILAGCATLTWFMRVMATRIERRFRDRVGIALEARVAQLHARVATIEHTERTDYMDRLSVLRDQVFALDHLFLSVFSTLGWILRLVFTIVLLGSIHPALMLLVLFALPTVVSSTHRPGVEREVEESVASRMRLARHLFVLGTTPQPAKEVRVSGTGAKLIGQRRQAADEWYEPVARARWMTALWESLGWLVFGIGFVAAIVFIASAQDGTVGQVILVLVAGSRLSSYIGAAVGELGFLRGIWLDSSQRLCWLEDFVAARDEQADQSVPERLVDGISFEHVWFRYPGTDRMVLTDVNLYLPAGSVVAIVGENGAGKTTLVKLLCRMYAPTEGRILADGIDIGRMRNEEWRERLAGAFQDFFRFEFQAQSTVGLGDQPRMDDVEAVETAVERAGAVDVIERLAYGLGTQLGPTWDEGVEVSFGQWQKLALARGFMRDDPLIIVLDEPTAALDAETEHALFERYAAESRRAEDGGGNGLTNGRVTVLVSHRFSTVRMADLIVMLDGSRVVEVGSHDELMALDGQYAELYKIQATAYR
jgi:ATP-binding cassette, subfamily B, bacterial